MAWVTKEMKKRLALLEAKLLISEDNYSNLNSQKWNKVFEIAELKVELDKKEERIKQLEKQIAEMVIEWGKYVAATSVSAKSD